MAKTQINITHTWYVFQVRPKSHPFEVEYAHRLAGVAYNPNASEIKVLNDKIAQQLNNLHCLNYIGLQDDIS